MELQAGQFERPNSAIADWAYLDIGFSQIKSSGLLLPSWATARNLDWADACEEIVCHTRQRSTPLNLMIEAPLSIAFDRQGNPVGRVGEKRAGKTRYWYMQGGAVVMVAAAFLLMRLSKENGPPISLFEAFISFKQRKSDHKEDADLMRELIVDDESPAGKMTMLSDNELRPSDGGELISSTARFGLDFGVPPIAFIDAAA